MAAWEWAIPGWNVYKAGQALSDVDWNRRPTAPQIGESPFLGDYRTLIGQLQARAEGRTPSIAERQVRQAGAQAGQQIMAMGGGGSPGAARQAGQNLAGLQGMVAQRGGEARLAEQMAAQQALQGTLGGAQAAWMGPQQANLLAMLQSPTNLQMLTGLLAQLGGTFGTIAGGAGGAGGAAR